MNAYATGVSRTRNSDSPPALISPGAASLATSPFAVLSCMLRLLSTTRREGVGVIGATQSRGYTLGLRAAPVKGEALSGDRQRDRVRDHVHDDGRGEAAGAQPRPAQGEGEEEDGEGVHSENSVGAFVKDREHGRAGHDGPGGAHPGHQPRQDDTAEEDLFSHGYDDG